MRGAAAPRREYPERIVVDLDAALARSLRAVAELRAKGGAGAAFVLPDGHEMLPLPEGRFARALTRADIRRATAALS